MLVLYNFFSFLIFRTLCNVFVRRINITFSHFFSFLRICITFTHTLPTLARKKEATKTRILFLLLAVNLRHSDIFRKNTTPLGGSRAEIIANAAVRRFVFSICESLFLSVLFVFYQEIDVGFINGCQ